MVFIFAYLVVRKVCVKSVMVKYCVLIVSLFCSSVVYAGEIRSEEDLWFLGSTKIHFTKDMAIKEPVIYTRDIVLAFLNIFRVRAFYFDNKTNMFNNVGYIEVIENSSAQIISYHEYKNDKRVLNRSFYCYLFEYRRGIAMCFQQIYYVDGKEVKFNEDLKGKDPVYDWVVNNSIKRERDE